jgi:hypothetical protein
MRVPIANKMLYFKATLPHLAWEVRLVQLLEGHRPACTPELIAADPGRGWMITCDAGKPMSTLVNSVEDLRVFEPVLPLLAGLQKEWLGRQDELVALGLFDRRIERLPDQFERLLADRSALMIGPPFGLEEEQYQKLREIVPSYRKMCGRLLEYAIPQSLHFDDMHTNNIFQGEDRTGASRVTFQDWGDSAASHPFCSLLIFLRAVSDRANLPEEATATPEGLPAPLLRLRDSYLEAWEEYETRTHLVEIFNLAWRVGMVSRALSWYDSLAGLPVAFRPDYRYTVPAWLGEFLAAM